MPVVGLARYLVDSFKVLFDKTLAQMTVKPNADRKTLEEFRQQQVLADRDLLAAIVADIPFYSVGIALDKFSSNPEVFNPMAWGIVKSYAAGSMQKEFLADIRLVTAGRRSVILTPAKCLIDFYQQQLPRSETLSIKLLAAYLAHMKPAEIQEYVKDRNPLYHVTCSAGDVLYVPPSFRGRGHGGPSVSLLRDQVQSDCAIPRHHVRGGARHL